MTKVTPNDVHTIDFYLSPVSETATIRKLNVSAFDRRKSRLKRIIINSFRGHFMKIDSRLDFENLDSFLRDHPIYYYISDYDCPPTRQKSYAVGYMTFFDFALYNVVYDFRKSHILYGLVKH